MAKTTLTAKDIRYDISKGFSEKDFIDTYGETYGFSDESEFRAFLKDKIYSFNDSDMKKRLREMKKNEKAKKKHQRCIINIQEADYTENIMKEDNISDVINDINEEPIEPTENTSKVFNDEESLEGLNKKLEESTYYIITLEQERKKLFSYMNDKNNRVHALQKKLYSLQEEVASLKEAVEKISEEIKEKSKIVDENSELLAIAKAEKQAIEEKILKATSTIIYCGATSSDVADYELNEMEIETDTISKKVTFLVSGSSTVQTTTILTLSVAQLILLARILCIFELEKFNGKNIVMLFDNACIISSIVKELKGDEAVRFIN